MGEVLPREMRIRSRAVRDVAADGRRPAVSVPRVRFSLPVAILLAAHCLRSGRGDNMRAG
jgi:hypothetical protein